MLVLARCVPLLCMYHVHVRCCDEHGWLLGRGPAWLQLFITTFAFFALLPGLDSDSSVCAIVLVGASPRVSRDYPLGDPLWTANRVTRHVDGPGHGRGTGSRSGGGFTLAPSDGHDVSNQPNHRIIAHAHEHTSTRTPSHLSISIYLPTNQHCTGAAGTGAAGKVAVIES